MSVALLLFAHTLKRTRVLLIAMGGMLALFQVLMILTARSIQQSGSFEQLGAMLPPFLRQLMGPSLASFMSFSGIVSFGYFDVPIIGALVALSIALATLPASEVETGFLDLILARPIARHWIVTRMVAAILLATILVLTAMMVATWAGLKALAPENAIRPSSKLILSLAINLCLLTLCWGGIAMAIGAGSRRRSVAAGTAGLLALAMFLLDSLGNLWRPAGAVAWLSPFSYYNPFDLVMGNPLPLKHLIVLAAIAAAGFAASYVIFARRDL